jgi:Fic family protein
LNIDIEKLNSLKIDFNFIPDSNYYLLLAKKDRVDFVYNTSALEGNPFTYPEVQTLLEGITVGGHKLSDEQMVLNQNESVELLFELVSKNEFKISKDIFCKLHEKVSYKEALTYGRFREGNVNIGGTEYKPPNSQELDMIFDSGIKKIKQLKNPLIKAIIFFLFGAKNQFFYDGNKRTSRLMMNGILLNSGYPVLNIKAKDKLEFNTKMIAFYENGVDEILSYLIEYYKKENKHITRRD